MVDFQQMIDAISYPPTHQYLYDPLTPLGVLKEREELILRACPEFYGGPGESFLDIGFNKGYFTLAAEAHGARVTGIEPDLACWELVGQLRKNIATYLAYGSFADAEDGTLFDYGNFDFDRVFCGNGPHYPYREAGGWGWLDKLGRIIADDAIVVFEGPTGMECADMQKCIPLDIQKDFHYQALIYEMEERAGLKLVGGPYRSPSYTPDRWITVWTA